MDYYQGMSRVLTSESTGAAVYVFSDDHCGAVATCVEIG